ncbi:CAP domain-containing protein [Photobacterium sanctipauli]|uniref:CAP domain-containing protein n=1 Tax=Photobacterium sanctipauli TaxID=1342794 RepID=A0A2T3P013_9GAMM|nr:CAP domain-containing protein [Photobacterium sanctipauli]PSW21850.1 CAP domain-containing protein [Photobacterium sanctipauli]
MRVVPIILLSSLLLVGCGSGGSDSSGTNSGNNGGDVSDGSGNNGDNGNNGDDGNDDDQNGGGNWPEPSPPPPPSDEFADQMLYAVNLARSEAQNCGGEMMPAVPALEWDLDLEAAAYRHSSDMANLGFMDHTGSDGSSPGDRIADTGYQSSAWAENVAAGQRDIDEVMTAWMNSPGHCKNIMSANVTEMGASLVENPGVGYSYYWTQVFARPR